ncbi:MAG: hypothetical protein Q9188_005555, partial [Gyalolechia gomerana]
MSGMALSRQSEYITPGLISSILHCGKFLVKKTKLRFDFSHKASVKADKFKKIEGVSERYIQDGGMRVFSSDVNLPTTRQIQGVRAVFGEAYQDPVRVVSIGIPVDKLVLEVTADELWKYSVESWGSMHVDRTGEIKELVVVKRLEKPGASRATLEKKALSDLSELFIKVTQGKLAYLTIPLLTKTVFTTRLDKVVKDMMKEQKEMLKVQVDTVIHPVKIHFQQCKASTSFVAMITGNTSAKAVSEAVKHFSSTSQDKSFIGVEDAT